MSINITSSLGAKAGDNLRNVCKEFDSAKQDRLLQKDDKGNIYTVKRRGFASSALVGIVVRIGALFKVDLYQRLDYPQKDRTNRASQEFREMLRKYDIGLGSDDRKYNKVSVKDVTDSLGSFEKAFPDLRKFLVRDKGDLEVFFFSSSSLEEGYVKEIAQGVGWPPKSFERSGCQVLYNLLMDECYRHNGNTIDVEKARQHLSENKDLVTAASSSKDLAEELYIINKCVKDGIRRLGILSYASDADMATTLAELFHPSMFSEAGGAGSQLRLEFFKKCVEGAFADLAQCHPDAATRLSAVLGGLPDEQRAFVLPDGYVQVKDERRAQLEDVILRINNTVSDKSFVDALRSIALLHFTKRHQSRA